MYRISVLSDHVEIGQRLAEQTKKICNEQGYFPKIDLHHNQEDFFHYVQKSAPTNAIIAIEGVEGLNAVEHLRSFYPVCGLIWCSDLDFSLHAYRLRAEYFILMPVTDNELKNGLSVWMRSTTPNKMM